MYLQPVLIICSFFIVEISTFIFQILQYYFGTGYCTQYTPLLLGVLYYMEPPCSIFIYIIYRYGKSHLSLQCKQRPSRRKLKVNRPMIYIHLVTYPVPQSRYLLNNCPTKVWIYRLLSLNPLRDIQNHTWELILQADHRSYLSVLKLF